MPGGMRQPGSKPGHNPRRLEILMKIKTIKLSDGHSPSRPLSTFRSDADFQAATRFRVEQITDTIEFHTGQLLERHEVEYLCESSKWKVIIVPHKA